MKQLTTILLLILSLNVLASDCYVSKSGNDANPGTISSPVSTITKALSIATGGVGDTIYLNKGDSWLETVRITTLNNGIVFSSYGTGSAPEITGLQSLTSWTNAGSGLYKSVNDFIPNNVNIVTINGVLQTLGRTPNEGSFYTYTSASSSQLVSSSLTGTPSYVNAEVVYRAEHYVSYKAKITSQSTSTINYIKTVNIDPSSNGLSLGNGKTGFGFFVQRHLSTLDKVGEYFFDTTAKELYIYFGALNPASYSIKSTVKDTVISVATNVTGIVIDGIKITGGNYYGIYAKSAGAITVKNCEIGLNTVGVMVQNCDGSTFTGNTFPSSACNAISVIGRQSGNYTVSNNTVTNTGQIFGNGIFNYDYQMKGIALIADSDRVSNTNLIQGNVIKNTGFTGLEFQGSNVTIEDNFVDTFCNKQDDGGGIYTFVYNVAGQTHKTFINRVVKNNIIGNCVGATAGTNNADPDPGSNLYFDDATMNVEAYDNFIFNNENGGNGIQLNNTQSVYVHDNIVSNATYGINANKKAFSSFVNTRIRQNQVYPSLSTQYAFFYVDKNL